MNSIIVFQIFLKWYFAQTICCEWEILWIIRADYISQKMSIFAKTAKLYPHKNEAIKDSVQGEGRGHQVKNEVIILHLTTRLMINMNIEF